MIKLLALDKPMASLSTCHLELVVWDGNLIKSTCSYVIKQVLFSCKKQLALSNVEDSEVKTPQMEQYPFSPPPFDINLLNRA